MDIKITVGSKVQETISLNARKSLDGSLMIFDHQDIDIVLMLEKKKVITFPKEILDEFIYEIFCLHSKHSPQEIWFA